MEKKIRKAGDKKVDLTPNEHMITAQRNFDNPNYATDNQYGVDLSGIKYKDGIEDYFGDDASIGGNNVTAMLEAGYSADDIYNFTKARGLNYNKHGRKSLQREGNYAIGKGSDQWGDILGYSKVDEPENVGMIDEVDELTDVPTRGNFGIQNAPVNQTITNSTDSELLDDLIDESYGFSGGGMGVDYNQTQNINYNDLQDFDISGSNNYINAPLNASNSITGGDVTFANRDADGLNPQYDPNRFRELFIKNYFS